MKLKEQIEQMQQELIPEIPDDVLETLQGTTKELVESGIAEQAIGTGDTAPDFVLPYATGNGTDESWSLSSALQDGPVVLSFYRGGW